MNKNALIVFTAKSVESIQQLGGTSSWVLSPSSMRDVRYVVCTRNTDRDLDDEFGIRAEAHGEAFLVGKVSGLKQVGERNNRKRYLVQMSEYALVSVPDFWTHDRNPTRYTDSDILRAWGIDVEALEWHPMPAISAKPERQASGIVDEVGGGLTIAEAKRGLARKFGVSEDAIQIVING